MTQEPTKKQIEQLWQWCGFKDRGNNHPLGRWLYPNNKAGGKLPELDLNNFFEYIFNPLVKNGDGYKVEIILSQWINKILTCEENYNNKIAILFYIAQEVLYTSKNKGKSIGINIDNYADMED